MCIKKFTIRFSLLLAGFFLLAHAVLPHTHHDGIICFTEDITCHCDDHSTDLSHQATHHGHHDSDGCDLKDNVLRQADSDDPAPTILTFDFLSLCHLGYHLSGSHLDPPEIESWLRHKPYLETYTSPCVASVKSLRAPPFSFFG